MSRGTLKLMCVLAHPDDESLGLGGALAKYAAEGVETYLVTVTRGERGWNGKDEAYPGLVALGKIRTRVYRPQVWQAISCHRSQLPFYEALSHLSEEEQANLWGVQKFYRAFNLVNGGRQMEKDLFEGVN
ncbi:MAG TPA: hypothetical protein DEP47_06780 [Chloroflexi bacterium]|jgi:hypothetical protein|nr:hypothetical protein [Chloroflexota bacterium]